MTRAGNARSACCVSVCAVAGFRRGLGSLDRTQPRPCLCLQRLTISKRVGFPLVDRPVRNRPTRGLTPTAEAETPRRFCFYLLCGKGLGDSRSCRWSLSWAPRAGSARGSATPTRALGLKVSPAAQRQPRRVMRGLGSHEGIQPVHIEPEVFQVMSRSRSVARNRVGRRSRMRRRSWPEALTNRWKVIRCDLASVSDRGKWQNDYESFSSFSLAVRVWLSWRHAHATARHLKLR